MGVHGLWRLLDSFGVVVGPDELRGKRVAVDASIWIAQFRARVAPGEDVEQKILEGFLVRILKLLFYGIRPVFVFDSATTLSKDAELRRRRNQRAKNERALLKRKARQILMAQVASGKLNVQDLTAVLSATFSADNEAVVTEEELGAVRAPAATGASEEASAPDMGPRTNAAGQSMSATSSAHRSAVQCGKRHRDDSEKILPPFRPKHRQRFRKKISLAPDAVSASITQSFLSDAEGFLEERARYEAQVSHNALQYTSTSLYMGPRCAVDDSAKDVADVIASGYPEIPCQNYTADVVSVSEDSQVRESNYIVVSDSERNVEVASSLCCTTASVDSGEVEEMVLADKASTIGCWNAAEKEVPLSSPTLSLSSSSTVLESGDVTRYLNALPSCTCKLPPPPEFTRIVGERSSSTALSISSATCVSADTEKTADSDRSSTSTSRGAFCDGDPEEEEEAGGVTNDASDSEGDDAKSTWEPYTQRLHLTQLLGQQVQESESCSDPSSSSAEQAATVSCLTPPRTCSEKVGEEKDDDDYTPVKAGEYFSRFCTASPPKSAAVFIDSNRGVRGHAHILVEAGEPLPPRTEFHRTQGALPSKMAAEFHGFSGAERNPKRIVPFELLKVVELLDCCGLPFVLSPAEADAQCAFLTQCGLVDAVFTEDSDVVVHGATTVLRGFFAQSKNVVAYEQRHLAACGITKTVLVALASLLGCDYTEGISGIGLVGALKAIVVSWTTEGGAEADSTSSSAVLRVLERWVQLVERPPHSWQEVDDNMTILQFVLLQENIAHWRSLIQRVSFPEAHAVESFFDATVDSDANPFDWLPPDWHRIRVFAGALGALSSPWILQRYELARKECMRCEAETEKIRASRIPGQRNLDEYGMRERSRATWAYQKQPIKHTTILSHLRAVQQIQRSAT